MMNLLSYLNIDFFFFKNNEIIHILMCIFNIKNKDKFSPTLYL